MRRFVIMLSLLVLATADGRGQNLIVVTNNYNDLNPDRDALTNQVGIIRIVASINDGSEPLRLDGLLTAALRVIEPESGYTNATIAATVTNDVGIVRWSIPAQQVGTYRLMASAVYADDDFPIFDRYMTMTSPPAASCGDVTVINNITNATYNIGGQATTNAGDLTEGTLDNARLSTNVTLLGQTIDGTEIVAGSITSTNIDAATDAAYRSVGAGGATNFSSQFTGDGMAIPLEIDESQLDGSKIGGVDAETVNGQHVASIVTNALATQAGYGVLVQQTTGTNVTTNTVAVDTSVIPSKGSNNTFTAVQTIQVSSNLVVIIGSTEPQGSANPAQIYIYNPTASTAAADYTYGVKLTLGDTRGSGAAHGAAMTLSALNYNNSAHWVISTDVTLDGNPYILLGTNLPTGTLTLRGIYHSFSDMGFFAATGTRGTSISSYAKLVQIDSQNYKIRLNYRTGSEPNRFDTEIYGTNNQQIAIFSNGNAAVQFRGYVNAASNDLASRGYRVPVCQGIYTNANQAGLTLFGNLDFYFDAGSNYYIHSVNGTWSRKP